MLLAATACAGGPAPLGSKGGPDTSSAARSEVPTPTGAKGGSPPPIPGVPSPMARCVARPTGAPMVLIGGALYEVADPVHPTLLCQISNTIAHLYTGDTFTYIRYSGDGTEVVLHSIGSGNESVISGFPLALMKPSWGGYGAFSPDGSVAANAVAGTDSAGNATIQIWVFSGHNIAADKLYEFPQPLTDCICRFGLPRPTLAFSPDGLYLVAGWPIGKGATPLMVYRVADRSLVKLLDQGDENAIWSRTGHRLYVTSRSHASRSWTPEDGYSTLPGAGAWPFEVGLSPDGSQVAYTAYVDELNQLPGTIRVHAYNLSTNTDRLLIDRSRSEVTFVKNGWVWYLDEAACDSSLTSCGPWGTAPTGKVFAMDLSTGIEQTVAFNPGESLVALQSGFGPAEFWPNS